MDNEGRFYSEESIGILLLGTRDIVSDDACHCHWIYTKNNALCYYNDDTIKWPFFFRHLFRLRFEPGYEWITADNMTDREKRVRETSS